ncbi:MAG: Hemin uptake protein hemP [Pseudomonadota bacterium]|jgi:hemin uptake protein HemP
MIEHTLNYSGNPEHSESPLLEQPISSVRSISSESLLANGNEVFIRHQGERYHLKLTRNNKLILTK